MAIDTPPQQGSAEPRPQRAGSGRVGLTKDGVLADYRIGYESRQASLIGRREVLTGKGKFGIFGDGKEVAQLAMARAFSPGDVRAGYYRDQTVMLALGLTTVEELFSQLYADPDPAHEVSSAGRQMNAHFATRFLAEDGSWLPIAELYNSSADLSPTGSQMPRLAGLAQASKLYRELEIPGAERFSTNGNEIAWGTIGNASSAEGLFWETVNAVGVLKAPMLLSIWDDGYGISVPNEYQVTKGDLSKILAGFGRAEGSDAGYDLYRVRGWDYPALCETYAEAAERVRETHVPAIVHVVELTQPQGHSTSGSHERYKSPERLQFESDFDGLVRMRRWMLDEGVASEELLDELESKSLDRVRRQQRSAWERFRNPIEVARLELSGLLADLLAETDDEETSRELASQAQRLERMPTPGRRDLVATAHDARLASAAMSGTARQKLLSWLEREREALASTYSSHLTSDGPKAASAVPEVAAVYADEPEMLRGFEILNAGFDAALARDPRVLAFGEDLGYLGDVNQGFSGLQAKYGPIRVSDTGIREATIVGQAIGLALRGLRPIAEIQYLDYLLYALQIISDDLATLRWRSAGGQKAPVILRTRGHRLEGVWHSGSPMAGLIHLVRGVHVCVPRDMTQAVGFYNTLLQSDDPGLVIEVLNGYRLKEPKPDNLEAFTVPLGVPEVIRQGEDVTLVTYGALCRIALEACEQLERVGVDVEVIDVRTLLPFDRHALIRNSLEKTNRIVFLDEDVPGGGTAYMMQQVLDAQGGYEWLDAEPVTLCAAPHRPAYGSDGDYASKPNRESIFDTVYALMRRCDPARYPSLDG